MTEPKSMSELFGRFVVFGFEFCGLCACGMFVRMRPRVLEDVLLSWSGHGQ